MSTAGLASVAAVGVACGPQQVPVFKAPEASTPGKAQWETEWDALVTAAKREGTLVVHTPPSAGWRQVFDKFQDAFPGITVEHTSMSAGNWTPKILQERQAGVYAWDVSHATAGSGQTLLKENLWDPLRPQLFRPDILNDQAWISGQEFGYRDTERKYTFMFGWNIITTTFINTDLASDVRTARDILNPKWKGKIVIFDPRLGAGAGLSAVSRVRLALGGDALKQLLIDQEPTFSRDMRQMNEFLIRGQYAIEMGTNPFSFAEFEKQGLMGKVKAVVSEGNAQLFGDAIWLVNRTPHPNVAKLYANWVLTKEGQQHYAQNVKINSRRTDVEKGEPSMVPPAGAEKTYSTEDTPEWLAELEKTKSMIETLLR